MIVEAKMLAVMDTCTRIPLIAFKVSPNTMKEGIMLERHGFTINPHQYTFFYDLNSGTCSYDPYKMNDFHTLTPACRHIERNWDSVKSGDLIDVEYMRGDTDAPRIWEGEYVWRELS